MIRSQEALRLARKYVDNDTPMASSAQACLEDAERLAAEGKDADALRRAAHSLEYSMGVFAVEYQQVARWAAEAQ